MKFIFAAILVVGIICLAEADEDRQNPSTEKGAQETINQAMLTVSDNKDIPSPGEATVSGPHLGGGGFGYGSKTVYHKSYGGHGGYGHHHGGGGALYHHSHYSHSAGLHGGYLRETHGQQQPQQQPQQQAIVGNTYGYPSSPGIPCPQNMVVQCAPSITPVTCSGGY